MSDEQLQRVLDPAFVADLEARPTDELRALRAECEAVEEGVSYARRLLQGRVDILRAELVRRREAGSVSAGELLSSLAGILANDQRLSKDPYQARNTRLRVPASAEHYERELDQIVDESQLGRIDGEELAELARLAERLGAYERELSEVRHVLFHRIDTLRAELADRYKDGRAVVSELLQKGASG